MKNNDNIQDQFNHSQNRITKMQSRVQHRACTVLTTQNQRAWESHRNHNNFAEFINHDKSVQMRKTHHHRQKEKQNRQQENVYANSHVHVYSNAGSTNLHKDIYFDFSTKINLKANLAPKNPPNISNHYKYNQRPKQFSQPLPRNSGLNRGCQYFQQELHECYQAVHSDEEYIQSSMDVSQRKQTETQAKMSRIETKKINQNNVRFGVKQLNGLNQKDYRASKDVKDCKLLKEKDINKNGVKKFVKTKQFNRKPQNQLKIKTSNLIRQPKVQKKVNFNEPQFHPFPVNDKIRSHNSPNERYKKSVQEYTDLLQTKEKHQRKSVSRVIRQPIDPKLMKSSKGSSKIRKDSRNAYTELNKSSQFTSVDEISRSSIKKQVCKKTKHTKSNNNLFEVQRKKAQQKRLTQLKQNDLFSKRKKIAQKINRIQQQTSFDVIQQQDCVFLCDEQMQPLKQERQTRNINIQSKYKPCSGIEQDFVRQKVSLLNFCCEVTTNDEKTSEHLKTAPGALRNSFYSNQHSKSSFIEIALKKSVHTLSPQQQIRQFEARIDQINGQFQVQSFKFARLQELKYLEEKLDASYLQLKQKNLTWAKRSVLVSWMIEALQEQGNQRETFAKSVALLDLFLSSPKNCNIQLKDFQLIGAVCMLISAKLEQNNISLDFVYGTFGGMYQIDDIQKCEQRIMSTLQWKLNPPTANMWANRLGKQWDSYIQAYPEKVSTCMILSQRLVKFKEQSEQYYLNYRCLMQYIDFALLDIQTLQYQPCVLAASFIYIVLLKKSNLYSDSQIVTQFPKSSKFLQPTHPVQQNFNQFFNQFLKFTFDMEILELLPTIQYAATFLILPLVNSVPQQVEKSDRQFSYEELCSFQTKNQFAKDKLKSRNRDLINC